MFSLFTSLHYSLLSYAVPIPASRGHELDPLGIWICDSWIRLQDLIILALSLWCQTVFCDCQWIKYELGTLAACHVPLCAGFKSWQLCLLLNLFNPLYQSVLVMCSHCCMLMDDPPGYSLYVAKSCTCSSIPSQFTFPALTASTSSHLPPYRS
jgi:hypothetical protein